jgi:hypothetical protein
MHYFLNEMCTCSNVNFTDIKSAMMIASRVCTYWLENWFAGLKIVS